MTPLSETEAIDLVKTAFASAAERDIMTVSCCLSFFELAKCGFLNVFGILLVYKFEAISFT